MGSKILLRCYVPFLPLRLLADALISEVKSKITFNSKITKNDKEPELRSANVSRFPYNTPVTIHSKC